MTQHLRLSQYVITYGPGAILEAPEGPRIIPRPDIGLFYPSSGLNPAEFVISDQRMSQGLLAGAQIFRLPSNAELGLPQNRFIYRTRPFPSWSLCLNTRGHEGNFSILYQGRGCPVCGISGRRTQEAIRFIMACPEGHMDDVNWPYLVHRSSSGCEHRGWFRWYGGGGALSQIEIECPQCGQRVNLGWAYGQQWFCSGRFPERESLGSPPVRPGCRQNARIIQRQASNLRIPELKTLFTIPPRYTRLHNLLQLPPIYSVLVAAGTLKSQNQLQQMLVNLMRGNLVTRTVVNEILQYPWDEIQQAIQDVMTPVSTGYHDLILEEFHALIDASVNGIPPVRGPSRTSPVIIEVNPNLVRRFPGPSGRNFRVIPILRLRSVTVQIGYRREVDTQNPANIVDVSFTDPGNPDQRWYPDVEFLGEGIFIMLEDNDGWHQELSGSAVDEWERAFSNPSSYPSHIFRSSHREELHPVFVWWHTLAHLLIRAISIEAGYASASIRERIYLEIADKRVRGGILIYATQPGSEGTLGGLIALVPYFGDFLDVALDMLHSCSGDPLCIGTHFKRGQYNGAACYGCLLISETSCEHRNMWLDRHILKDNLP